MHSELKQVRKLFYNVNEFPTLANCHFGNVHTAGVTKTVVVGAVVLKA